MTGKVTVRSSVQDALKEGHSARLSKIAALVNAENPFDSVLSEIEKMIDVIEAEAKADKENMQWCKQEQTLNNNNLRKRKKEIQGLEKLIDDLETTIGHPKTGLKKQIEETENSLTENNDAQVSETKTRTEENVAYQADVKNLVSAQGILKKALKVLTTYYDDLEKQLAGAFVQTKEDPAPPDATLNMEGQSSKGGDVMKMLNFILDETVKEENQAHADEEKAQADYEDSMESLKKQQAKMEKTLANLQEDLAEKEKELGDAQKDLKETVADKEAIIAYLAKIEPGCTFIQDNYDLREKNRATETNALNKATRLIKATPAYKTAVNAATVESYGDCKEPCVEDSSHVKCKACQADVTIPAYCAGHKGTKGC